MFVATLSLGEAIWSPRWYDYSMSVAPDGREGVFTALSSAPLFLAMLPTGAQGERGELVNPRSHLFQVRRVWPTEPCLLMVQA